MDSAVVSMLDFLRGPHQFSIPIFRRRYSWTEKDCRQLLNNILRVGSNDEIESHYFDSIVYIDRHVTAIGGVRKLIVIDGHQRLATLSLLLSALSLAIKDEGADIGTPKDKGDDIGISAKNFKIVICSMIRKENCAINYFSLMMINRHSLICWKISTSVSLKILHPS